ncbi:hypothetical protein NPIL_333001 [Nephila pilipes]|uniref:Uncharacterized protein n=1 Tax=Nephila pilipes TaxID=299642 RepID=A0A8X6U1X2_NEPPI|nr:hypothetical protein NPIL_333001 [Nephila pilipes]
MLVTPSRGHSAFAAIGSDRLLADILILWISRPQCSYPEISVVLYWTLQSNIHHSLHSLSYFFCCIVLRAQTQPSLTTHLMRPFFGSLCFVTQPSFPYSVGLDSRIQHSLPSAQLPRLLYGLVLDSPLLHL